MLKYDLSLILSKPSVLILNEEYNYLNSLDFDVLFEGDSTQKKHYLKSYLILRHLISGYIFKDIIELNLITVARRPIITDKGWSFIKWSISNRYENICKVIDELLEWYELEVEKKNLLINMFSLIPVNNYGIMISLSKDPSKLSQFMNSFSKV